MEQYEQAIRAPIGKTWNPETAVKELVKPKIVTKLGGIIQPISKADVFKKDSKKRKPDMGFQNKSADTKHKKRKHWLDSFMSCQCLEIDVFWQLRLYNV